MKEFFDTSVLVAAFRRDHVHHVPSLKRFAAAEKRHSACGLHSLAEVFSVMTTLPVKPMIPPEQALLFVEEIRNRLTLVSLSAEEYFAAIQSAASCKALAVYTWNLKHYQSLAPDLAPRIQTP